MKKQPLGILIASSHRVFDGVGGVEKFTSLLNEELYDRGHKTMLLYRRSFPNLIGTLIKNSEKLKRSKEKSTNLAVPYWAYLVNMIIFSSVIILISLRLAKKSHIDIIHAQDPVFAGAPMSIVSKLTGIPAIIHCHGSIPQPHRHKNASISWGIERLLYLYSIKSKSTFICTDNVTAEYLIEDGLSKNNCITLPAFIDSKFFGRNYEKKKASKTTLGYIGRLVKIKRVDLLIEALSHLKMWGYNVDVRIIGDGILKNDLIKLCDSLNVRELVSFEGWISNVEEILSEIDIFVLPSDSEGSPISLLEAMAAGKPCIVTNLRSIRNLVGMKCVKYFRRGNSKHLAESIREIIDSSSVQRELESSAREISQNFSIQKGVEKIEQIYLSRIKKISNIHE